MKKFSLEYLELKLLLKVFHLGGGSFLFSVTVGMTPILYIAAQLILPKDLFICQSKMVPLIYLVNDLNCKIFISTAPISSIVMPQPPILLFYLLLVVGMSFLPHILPLTLFASCEVNHKTTITIQLLFDRICPFCVSTSEFYPFH